MSPTPRQMNRTACLTLAALLASLSFAGLATAQESSLYRAGARSEKGYISLRDVSHTWQAPLEPNEAKLHDHITIIVDEKSLYQAKALLDREKRGALSAILQDVPILKGLSLGLSPQSLGDPALTANFDSILEADANHRTDERIAFRITVEVVEIRPNGTLVVEGHRQIKNNEEVWEQSLTGVIHPDKIDAGGIAKAEHIAELRIDKRERGEVRDGYRRGWVLRILDRIQTF